MEHNVHVGSNDLQCFLTRLYNVAGCHDNAADYRHPTLVFSEFLRLAVKREAAVVAMEEELSPSGERVSDCPNA